MKTLLLIALITCSSLTALANNQKTTILNTSYHQVKVDASQVKFVHNIFGYGCPIPGLTLPLYQWPAQLRHARNDLLTDESTLSMSHPNFVGCDAKKIAQLEKILFEKPVIEFQITKTLELVETEFGTQTIKGLSEKLEGTLNGIHLNSEAYIHLMTESPE